MLNHLAIRSIIAQTPITLSLKWHVQSTPTLTSVLPDFEQCGILAGEMACQKAANPSARPKPRAYGVLDIIRFARIAGHSILDEITDVRLQSAKSLLAQNDITLEAVANLSGWKDYNVFRNRFKALTGLSPNNWRKQSKNPA